MISLKFSPALSRRPQFGAAAAALALVLSVLAAGCAPTPVRPAVAADEGVQQAREAALARTPDWGLRGRVAVSAGSNGGSAGIHWRQNGADFDIELTAPITARSWRLRSRAGHATLEGLDGGPREGNDAEALLLEATGWRIPVAPMAAWARGARASGVPAELSVDPEGRPALLQQAGWTIEYRAWIDGTPPLPQKVFAKQGDASVRLVVDAWEP